MVDHKVREHRSKTNGPVGKVGAHVPRTRSLGEKPHGVSERGTDPNTRSFALGLEEIQYLGRHPWRRTGGRTSSRPRRRLALELCEEFFAVAQVARLGVFEAYDNFAADLIEHRFPLVLSYFEELESFASLAVSNRPEATRSRMNASSSGVTVIVNCEDFGMFTNHCDTVSRRSRSAVDTAFARFGRVSRDVARGVASTVGAGANKVGPTAVDV